MNIHTYIHAYTVATCQGVEPEQEHDRTLATVARNELCPLRANRRESPVALKGQKRTPGRGSTTRTALCLW